MADPDVPAELLAFVDAAPSPYHAAAVVADRLASAGFVDCTDRHVEPQGGGYVVRGGLLIAWFSPDAAPTAAFRVIGAHTDSPNLRLKPHPDLSGHGLRRLAVEPYGGALLNSWLDRDLGLSGRVAVGRGDDVETILFRDDRPLLRVPQLAIHLDRGVNDNGLVLNKQLHLHPVWGVGSSEAGDFVAWLAEHLDVDPADVSAWDLMCHDSQPAGFVGPLEDLISAPRLDNLASCFGALTALLDVAAAGGARDGSTSVIALFDHEEIGSETATGAASPELGAALDRLWDARGAVTEERERSRTSSRLLSADMAHGTHPNYPDRHEPSHTIALGGGPVIKTNVNGRYATDATTAAEFAAACRRAGVPHQTYAHRADLACGSTIGPISAARLGIATVDVGMAQLAMHSARELMATDDAGHMVDAFGAWLSG